MSLLFSIRNKFKSLLKIIQNYLGGIDVVLNIIWLFLDKVLNKGLGFLITVLLARHLGAENFGLWNYALAVVTFFGVLTTLGLQNIVVRELVREKYKKTNVLGSAFVLKIGGSLLTLIFSVLTLLLISPNDRTLQLVVFILAIANIFRAFDIIDYYFQSETKSKHVVIPKFFAFFLISICNVIFLLSSASLITFVIVSGVEIILGAIFMIFSLKRYDDKLLRWKPSFKTITDLLRESFPLIFAEIAVLVYMKMDQLMIGAFIGNEAVGIYSAAVRLSEMWLLIPFVLTKSVFPKVVKLRNENEKEYYSSLQRLFNLMAFIGILTALFISLSSELWVGFIFGKTFLEASFPLSIHVWSAAFAFLGFVSSLWFTTENLQKYILYRTCAGAVCNFALNFVLIPKFGINGAAIATLFSQFVASYFFNLFTNRTQIMFKMQTIAIINCLTLGLFFKSKN